MAGSSPRTWGTAAGAEFVALLARIIPTHVGNRAKPAPMGVPATDHPHARGEQSGPLAFLRPHIGSSPRTWGTASGPHPTRSGRRIIPTHVGNSCLSRSPCDLSSDHPHARGEQTMPNSARPSSSGSSPRTWGTAESRQVSSLSLRIIPTHVGNRATSCVSASVYHYMWYASVVEELLPSRDSRPWCIASNRASNKAFPHGVRDHALLDKVQYQGFQNPRVFLIVSYEPP